ncbi:MAG: hypothetical protein WKG01_28370 [Kofleriaceae bacterium]
MAERLRAELALHLLDRLLAEQLLRAVRGIVAELAGAVEHVRQRALDVIPAAVVRPRRDRVDRELACRAADHVVVPLERHLDHLALELVDLRREAAIRCGGHVPTQAHLGRQGLPPHWRVDRGEQECPLDRVLELANVAGPVVGEQRALDAWLDALRLAVHGVAQQLDEEVRQREDVLDVRAAPAVRSGTGLAGRNSRRETAAP